MTKKNQSLIRIVEKIMGSPVMGEETKHKHVTRSEANFAGYSSSQDT